MSTNSVSPTRELEDEVIHYFVNLAHSLGLPKSAGLIYGLLFTSGKPLAFKSVVERLSLSKGSVSQGLRLLQRLKAVKQITELNDRRTFYVAETSLRNLFAGFLEETVRPRLEQGQEQLEHLHRKLEKHENDNEIECETQGINGELRQRITSLRVWHEKAHKLIPGLLNLSSLHSAEP